MDNSELAQIRFCACANLRMASRALTQFYDEMLKPTGLRGTQFTVLGTISIMGLTPLTLLADQLVMDRTTLSRNLKPLQREGLVELQQGEDRRQRLVRITDKGQEMLERALPLWQQAQARVVELFDGEQFSALLANLSSVVSLVRE